MSNNLTVSATLLNERVISPYLIDKPDVASKLFMVKGSQGLPFFQKLRNMSMAEAHARNTGEYHEEDWLHPILHTAGNMSTVSAPAGQYSFVLSSTNGTNDYVLGALAPNFPAFGSTPYYYAPVNIGDRIQLPTFDDNQRATVYNITGLGTNTVTVFIRLDDVTYAPNLTSYVDGTEVIIDGSAFAAGTDQPEGIVNGTIRDFWFMQITKTNFNIDGDMDTNELWLKSFSDGKDISGYRAMGQRDLEYRHARKIDAILLWESGSFNNPLLLDSTVNNVVRISEGLIPYAKRKGNALNYTIGTFNPLTFDAIDSILEAESAPEYINALCDAKFDNEKDNALKNYFQETQINYVVEQAKADLFMGDTGIEAAVGFKYLKKGNRTYCFNRMWQFSDPHGHGATGYDGKNFAVFYPISSKPDPKNPGNKIPYMGMYYKALNGYSRLGEFVNITGASNGMHTTSKDLNQFGMKSQVAAVHVGGNQMVTMSGI